jgi:hypothetical protein
VFQAIIPVTFNQFNVFIVIKTAKTAGMGIPEIIFFFPRSLRHNPPACFPIDSRLFGFLHFALPTRTV